MTDRNILRIGIASREAVKRRTIDIARGAYQPAPDEPRVWFSSLESLAKVLSERNMLLLEMIRRAKPRSLTELAKVSGRAKSNLSRTLHSMERFGLVELRHEDQRRVPIVKYDQVQFALSLTDPEDKEAATGR